MNKKLFVSILVVALVSLLMLSFISADDSKRLSKKDQALSKKAQESGEDDSPGYMTVDAPQEPGEVIRLYREFKVTAGPKDAWNEVIEYFERRQAAGDTASPGEGFLERAPDSLPPAGRDPELDAYNDGVCNTFQEGCDDDAGDPWIFDIKSLNGRRPGHEVGDPTVDPSFFKH